MDVLSAQAVCLSDGETIHFAGAAPTGGEQNTVPEFGVAAPKRCAFPSADVFGAIGSCMYVGRGSSLWPGNLGGSLHCGAAGASALPSSVLCCTTCVACIACACTAAMVFIPT